MAFELTRKIAETLAGEAGAKVLAYGGEWRDLGWLRASVDALDALLGDRRAVGLMARNRPHHVAACLANLAAGRTTAMMPSGLGAAGLARTIGDLSLPAIIAEKADWTPLLLDAARGSGTLAIAASEDGSGPAFEVLMPGSPARTRPEGVGDIALELLSSGTTGAPKRIGLSWRTVEGAIENAGHAYAGSAARSPQVMVHPLGNISGLAYAMPPLVFGNPLVLLDRFTVEGWASAVREYRPVRGTVPPAGIAMLLESDVPAEWLASLDLVAVGGGLLPAEQHDAFEERFGVPVLTAYGATEFGGVVANWTLEEYRAHGAAKRGSAGRASRGARLRIVGSDGVERAPGEPGLLEACVDRIGPHWIRTNDLARIDADGFLFVDGRADAAINRGGFTIVPEVLENVLRDHPLVRDVAVVGLRDKRLGEVPVAAVEPIAAADGPTAEALSAWLRDRLPAYQIPASIRIVEQLPRTATLKVSIPAVRALFAPDE